MGVFSIGIVPMGVLSICAIAMGVINASVERMGIVIAEVIVMVGWHVGYVPLPPKKFTGKESTRQFWEPWQKLAS